ncbi:glycoside hydrolase family 2 TIM barrel-domain containing protein [Thalassotalea fonticola]|uniref:Glycoside hydrolase family 2 TIM barrel-domain containing protein n=1 Tax=Thalassotalea fonticola TaxID=3065649 RepID=A0ABZ0GRF6_9GAMM|nr:glycoside hydrolase family 2 TIM barrel-domain containing protein [Colwelliaceae bacterium S1-1]
MKIFKKIAITLIVLVILGWVFKTPLLAFIKPHVNEFMKDFPESKHKSAEVQGSYAQVACQNSHVDFGETVRKTQSLDGQWLVEQGALDDNSPEVFNHTAPVPGLLTEATPRFNLVGMESDEREAFWYKKSFAAPSEPSALANLCLHKAKYGTKVWLNGQMLGEHYGAFSVSEYDLSKAIRYGQKNELIIRVGAEHSSVPEFIPVGGDFEKYGWYPGLWDSVSVVYTGKYSIVRTKVDPNIDQGLAKIHTTIRNNSNTAVDLTVKQQINEWQSEQIASELFQQLVTMAANETITVTQDVRLSDVNLWSPESPFLYTAHTTIEQDGQASDDRVSRFGMRKVQWRGGDGIDSKNKGFYLNNKKYYLRGTNIALHRFFEDQDRKQLPWNKTWVNKLLAGQKDFHWNSFRFHVGRAPNFWYDIADELGFIVTDEYHLFAPVKLGLPGMPESNNWSLTELEKEFTAWVQENWNHASIGWWDASNENHNPIPYQVVPLVRHLDDTRVWESGSYRAPDRPNDPLEEHPYKLNGTGFMNSNDKEYGLADLDTFSRLPPMTKGIVFRTYDGPGARNHPYINNEYGWLWLTRDGSDPVTIAEDAYRLLTKGTEITAEQRREIYAYVVSELTGYWRARRGYAGIQHFLYLGKCADKDTIPADWDIKEASATCDNFIDIPNLVMEPRWAQWGAHAFAPVTVNLDIWSEDFYQAGQQVSVPVTLLNDTYQNSDVVVKLVTADANGKVLTQATSVNLTLASLADEQLTIDLTMPAKIPFVVYAYLSIEGQESVVISRRKVGFVHPGIDVQLPVVTSFLTKNN